MSSQTELEGQATERATKVQCMRFLFARPSSLLDDPEHLITWGEDGLPKLDKHRAEEVVVDDELLVSLYDEILVRERAAP